MTKPIEEVLKRWKDQRLKYLPFTQWGSANLEKARAADHQLRMIDALQAVLAIPEKDTSADGSDYGNGFNSGYNQCLADVRAEIEKGAKR